MSGHVDFDDFMSIANSNRTGKFPLEDLAKAIYLTRHENLSGDTHPIAASHLYDALPAAVKYEYLLTARRILSMLSALGFKVVRKEDLRPKMMVEFKMRYIKDDNELEFLAAEEHSGWVKARKKNGWKTGAVPNIYYKKDPRLVKYKNLKARDKEPYKDTIRHIPDYFENLDFKIVRGKRMKLKL
jgi:hypothetical protein